MQLCGNHTTPTISNSSPSLYLQSFIQHTRVIRIKSEYILQKHVHTYIKHPSRSDRRWYNALCGSVRSTNANSYRCRNIETIPRTELTNVGTKWYWCITSHLNPTSSFYILLVLSFSLLHTPQALTSVYTL